MSAAPQFDRFIHALCAERCPEITFSLTPRRSRFEPERTWLIFSDQSRNLYGLDCSEVNGAQNYFSILATAADYCQRFGLTVVQDWSYVTPLKEDLVSAWVCGRQIGAITVATTADRWRTGANHLRLDYNIAATLIARYTVLPDQRVVVDSVTLNGPGFKRLSVHVIATQTEVTCMISEPNDRTPDGISFEVSIAELTLSIDEFARLAPGDVISIEKRDPLPCFLKLSGTAWAEGEVHWGDGGVQIKIVETQGVGERTPGFVR